MPKTKSVADLSPFERFLISLAHRHIDKHTNNMEQAFDREDRIIVQPAVLFVYAHDLNELFDSGNLDNVEWDEMHPWNLPENLADEAGSKDNVIFGIVFPPILDKIPPDVIKGSLFASMEQAKRDFKNRRAEPQAKDTQRLLAVIFLHDTLHAEVDDTLISRVYEEAFSGTLSDETRELIRNSTGDCISICIRMTPYAQDIVKEHNTNVLDGCLRYHAVYDFTETGGKYTGTTYVAEGKACFSTGISHILVDGAYAAGSANSTLTRGD